MSDNQNIPVCLTFPKDKCEDITIKGLPFVKIDTGLTVEELIEVLLKWAVSEDPIGVLKKKEDVKDES